MLHQPAYFTNRNSISLIWLQEGFAQVAEGRARQDARRLLSQALAPSLAQLRGSFSGTADVHVVRRLYAGSCDLVHTLMNQGGGPGLADLLDETGKLGRIKAKLGAEMIRKKEAMVQP